MIPREKIQRISDHVLAARAEVSQPALRLHPIRLMLEMLDDLIQAEPDYVSAEGEEPTDGQRGLW